MSAMQLQQAITSPRIFAGYPRLPNTLDPVAPLLTRYFAVSDRPTRASDVAPGGSSYNPETLARTRRWRQLADWTADAIVISHDSEGADAQSIHRILQLWVVRIQCLRKLAGPGAKGILAHETDNLLECLPPFYPNPIPPYNAKERFFNSFIPFELILTYALLPVHLFAEGPPLDGHLVLQRLQDILVGCKHEYWRTQDGIWVERIRRVGICMANVLVRMQEWEQATSVLQGLRSNEGAGGGSNQGAREVQEALLLVYLEQSRLEEAAELLQTMDDKALDGDEARQRRKATVDRLRILLLTAQGLPDEAESLSEQVYDRRRTDVSERALGDACNLAACRLYAGKTAEGIACLRKGMDEDPDGFFNSATCLANLCALEDLQAGNTFEKKLDLLRAASPHAHEGLSLGDILRV